MKSIRIKEGRKLLVFIHSEIDDLGLSMPEFRLYCHLARRAGEGSAWPGLDSISSICRMSKKTAVQAIRKLEEMKLIVVSREAGSCNVYTVADKELWHKKDGGVCTLGNGVGSVLQPLGECTPAPGGCVLQVTKGSPLKVLLTEGDPMDPFYPQNLRTPLFKSKWNDWVKDRKERRKPITQRAALIQFKKLSSWGEVKAIQAIETSIANCWTGLFEPKQENGSNGQSEPKKGFAQL